MTTKIKTKIKWRLANRPTPIEVQELYTTGLLTKDEAREILFTQETDEDRDKKGLQDEIKFLRELVNRLSPPSTVVETIRYIEKPYQQYPWYVPYATWCTNTTSLANSQSDLTYYTAGATTSGTYTLGAVTGGTTVSVGQRFDDITTF